MQNSRPDLNQQAEFLDALIRRCQLSDGETSPETWLKLSRGDVEQLRLLSERMRRMGPFQNKIAEMVAGR